MLRNPARVAAFEDGLVRGSGVDPALNRRLYEALYRRARSLGVFPLRDPLDGIDVDVRLAQVLHVRTPAGESRPRA